MDKEQPKAFSSEKKIIYTYKLLKSGRSCVLFVSMATILGTRELSTEDLYIEKTDFSQFKSEKKN